MLQQTVVNMRNRTQFLTVLQFDLCGVQGDKLDHYRKGAVPEQQMFPISYVKGCKNIHQYTPGTGELLLVYLNFHTHVSCNIKSFGFLVQPERTLEHAQFSAILQTL